MKISVGLYGTNAHQIALAMIQGFNKHYTLFRQTCREAKTRFEHGDWLGVHKAVKERIRFYDDRVDECVERLRDEFDAATIDFATWQQVKLLYIGLLLNHKQPELAETFFNSVTTKILHRNYFHNDFIFVRPSISTENIEGADHCDECAQSLDHLTKPRRAPGVEDGLFRDRVGGLTHAPPTVVDECASPLDR